MVLHFAYGSNMSRALMEARCPTAQVLGPGRLDGFRYIVTRDGYGSIVTAPGARVHGVVWRLKSRDLAVLHAYERLDTGLYRARMIAVQCGGQRRRCLVYVARTDAPGRPVRGYQDGIVVPAARAWNFPQSYIDELARWASGGAR